jgi:hypothetical protein
MDLNKLCIDEANVGFSGFNNTFPEFASSDANINVHGNVQKDEFTGIVIFHFHLLYSLGFFV